MHHLKGLFYFTKIVADTPEFANTYLLYLSYREPGEQRGWGKTQYPTQRPSVGDMFAKGGTAAQPRWSPPISASYLPANCLERAVGRGVTAQAGSRGRAGAALPLGLKGRRWEPVGMSQHSSYARMFPPRERMLRTTLQHVQGWRARNRTDLYVLVTRVAPVGKSPSANSKKYLLSPHREAGGYPTPCGKMPGGSSPPQPNDALHFSTSPNDIGLGMLENPQFPENHPSLL